MYLVLLFLLTTAKFCNLGQLQDIKIIVFELRHPYKSDLFSFFLDTILMSADKEIKTNIQNSTLNSWFDALSKWHDPHIKHMYAQDFNNPEYVTLFHILYE